MSDVAEKTAIELERDHYAAESDQLKAEIADMEQARREKVERLFEISRRLKACDAYERALNGVVASGESTRARKGSRREAILNAIGDDEMSRAGILEKLGLKGDKAGEMSVSNALTSMKKNGEVSAENGVYFVPKDVARAA